MALRCPGSGCVLLAAAALALRGASGAAAKVQSGAPATEDKLCLVQRRVRVKSAAGLSMDENETEVLDEQLVTLLSATSQAENTTTTAASAGVTTAASFATSAPASENAASENATASAAAENATASAAAENATEVAAETAQEEISNTDTALAMMLLGSITFVMTLFYLVHWPDQDIQKATWKMLSSTLSIFSAVILFNAVKLLAKYMCNLPIEEQVSIEGNQPVYDVEPPTTKLLTCSGFTFIAICILLQVALAMCQQRGVNCIAAGAILAHMTGFAAIDFFGLWQQRTLFAESVSMTAFFDGLTMAGLLVTFQFMKIFRTTLPTFGKKGSEEDIYNAHVCEGEDDAAALAMGFLISRTIRYWLTEQLPPLYGAPQGKTASETASLGLTALSCGVCVLLLMPTVRRMQLRNQGQSKMLRPTKLLQLTLSMAMGWCLLYTGQWTYWNLFPNGVAGQGSFMVSRIAMALVDSAIVVVAVFAIDFVADRTQADRALRTLVTALGMLLGLAWESAFDEGVEDLVKRFASTKIEGVWMSVGLSVVLVGLVLPAWRWYLLPYAIEASVADGTDVVSQMHAADAQPPERPVVRSRLNVRG